MIRLVVEQPHYLYSHHLNLSQMRALAAELHDVYFVRMFGCFESILRHYWRNEVRDTRPPTQELLSRIADRTGVPQDTLDRVQEIREFRNLLIHEEHELRRRFTIVDASKHLNRYVARLPLRW
ncbi:MAG: hypothetical protein HYS13_02375 [Planctomycetia bacterium]|nr:hypothetical protein [Planctomycetia bacterium]